jgi:hypothetical protein
MGKFNEYTQKATPEDADSLMIYDAAAKANKLSPFSGIWNWIVEKLTNAVISNLQTSNKTVLGAINELNSKRYREKITGTTTLEEYRAGNGKLPGEYQIDGAIIPGISSTEKYWGVLILLNVYDIQIVIIGGGVMYIRDFTGNPNVWSKWAKYSYERVN